MPNTHVLTDAVKFDQMYPPASRNSAATRVYFDMSGYDGGVIILDMGAITAGGVADFKLQQATSSTGTSVKDVTGGALTQISDSGGSTAGISNSLYAIEFRTTALDLANGFTFVTALFTPATQADIASAIMIRHRGRILPLTTGLVERKLV